MNFSNFPFQGSFSESLKNSYQAYWKQDAEARESNRQLLVKLQRFEFKAAELGSRTQMAHQMKSQYEKMLMNQNPLLWAQIQRTLASDITDLHCRIPLSTSGLKTSKEAAVNTMDSSSCSEDGVWPHSPSPHPEMERKTENFSEEQEMINQQEHHKIEDMKTPPRHETLIVPTINMRDRSFQEKPIFLSPSTPEIHLSPAQSDTFLSTHSSPSTAFAESHNNHLETEEIQKTKEPAVVQDTDPQSVFELDNPNKTFVVATSPALVQDHLMQGSIPVTNQPADNERGKSETPLFKPAETFKPFRLDSDSESGPVSGPTGPPVEEDSDSFWN